jgi:hypothetical protein
LRIKQWFLKKDKDKDAKGGNGGGGKVKSFFHYFFNL